MPQYKVISDRYVKAKKGATVELDEDAARSLVRGEHLVPVKAAKPAPKSKKKGAA